jgi:imidazole glycerol-phosphate synthase subunit HisF
MLKKRIIPTLLYNDINLVKGKNFDNWRSVGSPITSMRIYNLRDVDEIFFAFIKNKNSIFDFEFLKKLSLECDVPLTIGGGIKSMLDVDEILKSGADKISINTSALENPDFIKEIVKKYGSQQIVLSVDFKKINNELYCFSNSGKKQTNIKLLDWIIEVQKLKVGEIILCSIDHDGTMKGYDIESLQKIIKYVDIPIIISGGAGSKEDILEAFKLDVSAVSISSLFHFTEITPKEIKNFLNTNNIPVRL